MSYLKLLIVDDVEDNRLVLKAICRKVEGYEIREACDGLEAVEIVQEWHPHLILMDLMMPRLDGFQASKIIKERYPETIIMIVTAVMDPHMEENMASIGVAAYIHKPIDKDLIRFKLQSFGALLRSREGSYISLSKKEALNPFNSDIRNVKTIFDIVEPDDMMDFGMWILVRCEERMTTSCTKTDAALGLFYELMRYGTRDGQPLSIIIEESFEELYVTMKFEEIIEPKPKALPLLRELGDDCIVRENIVCVRLHMGHEVRGLAEKKVLQPCKISEVVTKEAQPLLAVCESESAKEVRVIDSKEKEILRQSFVHKTTAIEYIRDIGGDVLDEIRDLESLDEEWKEKMLILEKEPAAENIRNFVDGVLRVYVHAINNLFEFTALGYALSTLGSFLNNNADMIIRDPKKLKSMVMLMEHMGSDLAAWREHIFGLKDAGDIHYLDSSFFSSCMQIEGIISEKEIDADHDDEMEFF